MDRKYDQLMLKQLQTNQTIKTEFKHNYVYKNLPGVTEDGVLDPYLYKQLKIPMTVASFLPKRKWNLEKMIGVLRKGFDEVKSIPITATDTEIIKRTIIHDNTEIPINIYIPVTIDHNQKYPVMFFIHGGGFVAGSTNVVEQAVKLLCETYPCVAVSIDYRLAPENPFPAGHDDCYNALKWIYENIEFYYGNKEKIFIAGDSAGGNIALYCSLKSKDENLSMIKAQVLYYPVVNLSGISDEYNIYKKENYYVQRKYRKTVFGVIDLAGQDLGLTMAKALGQPNSNSVYLSPYFADMTNLAPTILIYGEYDFLYTDCRGFAKKLDIANVPNKTIVYKGMQHAFLDYVGILAQAEDSVGEVISFIKQYLS